MTVKNVIIVLPLTHFMCGRRYMTHIVRLVMFIKFHNVKYTPLFSMPVTFCDITNHAFRNEITKPSRNLDYLHVQYIFPFMSSHQIYVIVQT